MRGPDTDLMTQMLWPATLLLGLAIIAIGVFLFRAVPPLERRFVFRPAREVSQTPARFGVPFEQFVVPTPDGERLSAWHLCPDRPLAAVLYCHGNSGNLGLFAEVLAEFYRRRLQVLAFDYRGYGLSSGEPTESGIYRDALAAAAFFDGLRSREVPLIVWGRSLGGPVAAHAAGRTSPAGVVLETTFPSKRVLLRNYRWPFRFCSIFSECRFETLRHLDGQRLPKLVIHGGRDRTIPVEQGRYLFRNLEEPKTWLHIPEADHIRIHTEDPLRYWTAVQDFVEGL